LLARLPKGEFFSLGSVLAACVRTRTPLAPWTLSAAILVALASWDPLVRGGRFDMILLGLAAYELLIALTQPRPETKVARVQAASRDWHPPGTRVPVPLDAVHGDRHR
jgi:hypothetical protein